MAIVSCPECSKKLKVADTSVGKKVKCSCGNVFVAEAEPAAPVKAAASAPAADKVVVACTECGAKLKVATGSLGKKMKCPKCAAAFVAATEEEAATLPPPKKPAKPAKADEDDDEINPPAPVKKGKAVSDDDMDDLFSFAQKDSGGETTDDEPPPEEEEEMPKPKGKGKAKKVEADEDEDDFPRPKSKFGGKKARKASVDEDDEDAGAKPVYPKRTLLNVLVLFLLLIFVGIFGGLILFGDQLPLPKVKLPKAVVKESEEDKKKRRDAEDAAAAENKKEAAKFNGAWIVESAVKDGLPLIKLKGDKFVFADGKVTAPDLNGIAFSVDAGKDPKTIDIPLGTKEWFVGIYKIDGDTLTWCTNTSGGEVKDNALTPDQEKRRPTAFDDKKGTLYVLKKEKLGEKKKEPQAENPDNAKEAAKLEGFWTIESLKDGDEIIEPLKGKQFLFSAGTLTTPDPEIQDAPITVDASKNPMWINITKGKKTLAGVYKLDGDTLQICYNEKTGKRPTKLDSSQGELFTLKRDKKGGVKEPDKQKKEPTDEAKAIVAQVQAKTLTQAVLAFRVKNDEFPPALADLLKKDGTGAGPYLESKEALLDPWNKPYQYDPAGPKNNGKQPDIWTVTPDKEIIGNWPIQKKGATDVPDRGLAFVSTEVGDRPTWTVPKGWKETKGGAFTVAAFAVEDKDKKVSVTVTPLGGKGGGLLANVNRWRMQLKLPAWSDEEFAKAAKKRKVGGIEGHYVELTEEKSAASIYGAIVFREDQVWFFKLMGDASLANREKENFSKFLDSVKFK